MHIISHMMVGHLGELPLSSASMVTSFAYVSGFSVLLGMASALETVCGQSYGAEQYNMVGIHTQRAIVLLMLISIPISVIWSYTETILVTLGQDHEIAAGAALYARFMIPRLFAYSLLQCLIRFFQTQNIVFPMMLTSGFTTLCHILISWLFVFKFGLGIKGAALANTISYWINCFLLALYVKFSHSCSRTWTSSFSKASFQGIPALLRLAIPSAVMVCLEMWSFEMIVLLSGLLSNPALETSVLSISLNTTSLVWVVPEGFSGAVSTRVSNELGAGNPKAARLAVYVVLCMTVSESIVVGVILILIRNAWGYAYSSEMEVVRYLASMMPLLALTNFVGLTCVLSGTARGCGWQKIGACINLGSFYLVGLPVAILLAFFMHIGGRGLWLGILCAITLQAISFLAITAKTNWEAEAKKATERVLESKAPKETVF